MKTPREILLQRQRSADARLDVIRHATIAAVCNRHKITSPRHFLFAAWSELILPCRRIWAGLAAVWIAIFVVHLADSEGGRTQRTRPEVATASEVRLAFQEQKRLLTEILDATPGPAAEPPRRSLPQPHSEIAATEVVV